MAHHPDEHRQQQAQGRPCLSCRRVFASVGSINRICKKCKERDAWTGSVEFSVSAAF